MIQLFHTGYQIITSPDITIGRRNADFGQGFYLSDNVEVHPLLVVTALIAGGAIGGIAGMLIAVPTAALIKMQFDRALQKMEESRNASGQS